jgi:quercetin dioxygenase-like cupin family protein
MLSKIERGENNPTLVVAVKVALGLGITTSELIGVDARRDVIMVPKQHRMVLKDPKTGFERQLLFPTFEGSNLEFVRHVLPPGATSGDMPAHKRGVEKYIVVAQGTLRVVLQTEEYLVAEEDALYFECDIAHRFENAGEGVCSYYLVINSRPS